MTTNFALSLSFEGIELLHRVPRGWRRVGRADVSSETLDADLAALRDKAMALDPDGLRTKLIIPRDQIKYTAIDSTQTTQDDIDAALDGATPYALDELAIDYERSGGRTHIAAVARETLREAEVFASGHGFRPVAFVAVAEPFTFQKEVFFGPTSMMQDILGAGAEVTRDLLPVMVVGTRLKSRLLVFDLPKEVEEDIYKDDLAALLSGQAVSEAEPPAPEPTEQISPATETQITIEEPDVTANVLPESDEPAAPAQPIWVDHVPAEYHKPSPPEDVAAVDMLPAFTLIPASPNFAHPPLLDAIIAEFHPSQFRPTKPKLVAMKQAAPKLAASAPAANRATAPKVSAPSKTPLIAAAVAGAALIIGAVLWSQQQSSEVASAPDTAVAPLAEQTTRPLEITQAAPEPLEAGPVTALVELADFGAENTDGGALPELATGTPAPTLLPAQTLATAPADRPPGAMQAPPAPETMQAGADDTAVRGTVLSPADAERIYEATGVWQRAPRFFYVPPSETAAPALDLPEPSPAPDRIAQPDPLLREGLDTDLSFIAPTDPPAPEVTFAIDQNGFIQATPEGTLTPEGALVFAGLPDLAITPRPELSQEDLDRMALLAPPPEGVVIIAGRPAVVPPLRPADAQLPQTALAAPVEEAPADERTPGSVGLAALEPRDEDTTAPAPSGDLVAAAALRPVLRPQSLAPVIDPGTPDITDIIAGIETDDATLRFENSTALAIALSPRPDPRPAGFRNTVAAALAQPEVPQAAPPAAPAPVIAAAPVPQQDFAPVPGGVARAATQEDAIRLRDINLIGVYGRPNARRALVRLGNGRYVRVEVGSALDGGQVTAIGDTALNYVKRGRTYAIELPAG